jgi:hypothetical protein
MTESYNLLIKNTILIPLNTSCNYVTSVHINKAQEIVSYNVGVAVSCTLHTQQEKCRLMSATCAYLCKLFNDALLTRAVV